MGEGKGRERGREFGRGAVCVTGRGGSEEGIKVNVSERIGMEKKGEWEKEGKMRGKGESEEREEGEEGEEKRKRRAKESR